MPVIPSVRAEDSGNGVPIEFGGRELTCLQTHPGAILPRPECIVGTEIASGRTATRGFVTPGLHMVLIGRHQVEAY